MSFQPHYHVQSGFSFDPTPSRPAAKPLNAGLFRPPAHSPSASAYGSLYSDISMANTPATGTAKRKRKNTRESTPMGWYMDMDGADDAREEETGRQTRYTLAGQIHATPMAPPPGAENSLLEESVYSDIDYRRRLGPTKLEQDEDDPPLPHHLEVTPHLPPSTGWRIFAPLSTIGSVVGKVWEFCTKGAFKGFHAGGGTRYTVNGSTVIEETGRPWRTQGPLPTPSNDEALAEQRIPEPFPEPSPQQETVSYPPFPPASGYRDSSSPDTTPQQPAAKRRQVSASNDELRNWVVVDQPANRNPRRFGSDVKAVPNPSSRTTSFIRPRAGYHAQTSASTGRRINVPSSRFTGGTPTRPHSRASAAAARASLRTSHAASPTLPPREPASFASPRRSTTTHATPSRIPVPIQLNPYTSSAVLSSPTSAVNTSSVSRPSSRQSPRHNLGNVASSRPISPTKTSATSGIHRRNQSVASTASTANRRHSLLGVDPEDIKASPRLDAEAKVLATRKLAVERDTDAKVDAFNAQLMAMIRQGREALGTKVEVMEMDDDDDGLNCAGGWEDDDI